MYIIADSVYVQGPYSCNLFLSNGLSSPLSRSTWVMRVRILGLRNLHSGVDRALVPILFMYYQSSSWSSGGPRSAGEIRRNTEEMGGYEVPAS
jgi:hypothetical protein